MRRVHSAAGCTLRGQSFAGVETVFTAFGDGPDPVEDQPVLHARGRLMPAIWSSPGIVDTPGPQHYEGGRSILTYCFN